MLHQNDESMYNIYKVSIAGFTMRRHGVSTIGLTALVFATVCGAPYGVEEIVRQNGSAAAITLLILAPLLWAAPIITIVSDLNARMPNEGGYYVWVTRVLGKFCGFQEGWLTLCYVAVDLAIYPVLFVDYLSYVLPALRLGTALTPPSTYLLRWSLSTLFIICSFVVQRSGISIVANLSAVFNLVSIAPFVILLFTALPRFQGASTRSVIFGVEPSYYGPLLVGLATTVWLYSGWDSVTTYAGEIPNARRVYRSALWIGLLLVSLAYVSSTMAGLAISSDYAVWRQEGVWPLIAERSRNQWLPSIFVTTALFSAWSLFNAQLLYGSRLPMVMSHDGWLPRSLSRLTFGNSVPVTALKAVCLVAIVLCALPFSRLVVVETLLYCPALALQLVTFVVLHVQCTKGRACVRQFRHMAWVIGIAILPFSCIVLIMKTTVASVASKSLQIVVSGLFALTGLIFFAVRRNSVSSTAGDQGS